MLYVCLIQDYTLPSNIQRSANIYETKTKQKLNKKCNKKSFGGDLTLFYIYFSFYKSMTSLPIKSPYGNRTRTGEWPTISSTLYTLQVVGPGGPPEGHSARIQMAQLPAFTDRMPLTSV